MIKNQFATLKPAHLGEENIVILARLTPFKGGKKT
jgi:hypothetical protein